MKRLLRCALLAAQLAACHHETAGQAQAALVRLHPARQ